MAEGPPERPGRASLPHILVPWAASEQAYRGRGGGGSKPIREIGNPQAHARKLTDELEAAQETAQQRIARVDPEIAPDGFALSVESWSDDPVYKLAVQSLDASGAKLLSVVPGTDETPDRAVVWFPLTAVPKFFTKIDQFATETTPNGAPRNNALIANIAELRLAVLRDLWQEDEPFPDPSEVRWWEVWLARLSESSVEPAHEPEAVLHAVAAARGWRVAPGLLTFPDNVIALVQTTGTELAELLTTNAVPSELHRPRVAAEILSIDPLDQDEFVADLAERIKGADPDAAAVCVLDTGVMAGHPLLSASIDSSLSALDGVGPADIHGHGTKMAGLALFTDLDRDLIDTGPLALRHRLESVKILRHDRDTDNDPEAYPVITATATAAVEVEQPRRRVFSMAVTVDDPAGSDGHPTSYSAAFDALAFGTDIDRSDDGIRLLGQPDPQAARLYVVSAGNVNPRDYAINYLDECDLARVQNPAQAWNVLTVGAYTELVDLPQEPMYAGWQPIAEAGELSPFSRTSTTISRSWPIKPDIVLEGGNLMVNASPRPQFFHDPALSLVTTSLVSSQSPSLLTTANATSAATARAARLAAVAMDRYPALWPETVRGLLVHAAEWTPAMQAQFKSAGYAKTPRAQFVRRYGWGVPTEARVLDSAASAVTLMIQDEFLPFEPRSSGIAMRALRLHELPWPREQLRDLFSEKVRLRVTLSYFVEPNPSSRGWQGRYRYASHGLRFDVKRPTETLEDFRGRLGNAAAREEGNDAPQPERSTDKRWYIGSLRNAGSLHADIWTGTGAELADSGYIGITPVGGWWKDNDRRDRTELPIRYALLVSLRTDAVAADIYTPIATQIGIPVPIET